MVISLSNVCVCVCVCVCRVEGKGSAVITDVIYSSKTTTDDKVQTTAGSKEEYEAVKVSMYCFPCSQQSSIGVSLVMQEELKQCREELKHLEFREQVLNKEKDLLAQFANHVSTIHSMKVIDVCLDVIMISFLGR